MKRTVLLVLVILVSISICSCASQYRTDITREEIVAAYEAAGYSVYSNVYAEKLEVGTIAYIQANHPNGDYIYFSFFESEADARSYEKQLDHPIIKGLFSVIFGDPMWTRMETYGCIVVDYWNPDLFVPFEKLLKGK